VGLAQLPLAAVAVRFCMIAWTGLVMGEVSFQGYRLPSYVGFGVLVTIVFFILICLKIASGLVVMSWAVCIVNRPKPVMDTTLSAEQRHEFE
jgi:hypothetical protein